MKIYEKPFPPGFSGCPYRNEICEVPVLFILIYFIRILYFHHYHKFYYAWTGYRHTRALSLTICLVIKDTGDYNVSGRNLS